MNTSRETKRSKSIFACAECHRLKIKCNRQVPCSTCVKRGCEILCPDNTMPPGGGSRFVNIAEEFLRQKIAKMEERMHSLEDALVIIQGSASQKPCQPLDEERSKWDVDRKPEVDQGSIIDNEFNKYGLTEVLGSLYLDDDRQSGPAALGIPGSTESLLLQAKEFIVESSSPTNHTEEVDPSYLPPEVRAFCQAFPFTPAGIPTEAVQDLIESYLPPLPRALALHETFMQSMSWMFSIISRQHILGELIPTVYKYVGRQSPAQLRSFGFHDIALLFIVFAIGALMDPSLPPYNIEGQHYHMLSRAALCLRPVLEQCSMTTIKTLHLMSIYNGMCGIDTKLENSSSLLNMAAQVALQIGFHKDPSLWGILGREAHERRTCFWDLLHKLSWQSLIRGHPPVIMPSLINCRMPTKEEEDIYRSSDVPQSCRTWCFSFAIRCLVPVVEATQAAHPPSYETILTLDCKIRQFSMPPVSSSEHISDKVQAIMRSQMRELALLFLHRSFFAQALLDFPLNPLKSPHRQSFLTAYQSAINILGAFRKLFMQQPALCARVWRIWTFAFSAAIIISAVAVKRLSITLEPEPFGQLDLACALFREAAPMSVRARKALPILLRLSREATQVRRETGSILEGDDSHGSSADSSIYLTHYPVPEVPYSEAPLAPTAAGYTQALSLPMVLPPLAKTIESDQEPHTGSVGFPLEWQSSYNKMPSWPHIGLQGPPSALTSHSPAYAGVSLDGQWTSFVHDRTTTDMPR